jgi:integrase
MQQSLTKRVIDQIVATKSTQFVWDTKLKGFGLKVTSAGKKVFIYQYRTGGRGSPTKRSTLGKYGDLTPDQARTRALQLAGSVAEGRDPRSEARERQTVAAQQAENTFARLVEKFIEQHAKKKQRNWRETKRLLDHDAVPRWGKRPAASITKTEVDDLLQLVAARAPITANRLLAVLRKLFNWAVVKEHLETSQVSGLPPPISEQSRDRHLDDGELARVISAANSKPYPFGPFYQLLIYTAQRLNEVSGMRWGEIKGDQWTIPAERSKNRRAHIVHLSPPALVVLSKISKSDKTDLVFTTTDTTPISGFSKAKAELDQLSSVKDWRFHDIRRTVTTGLANLGHPPHICDKILNHSTGAISGVAAVYQRYEYLEERKKALDDWGERVTSLMDEDGKDLG